MTGVTSKLMDFLRGPDATEAFRGFLGLGDPEQSPQPELAQALLGERWVRGDDGVFRLGTGPLYRPGRYAALDLGISLLEDGKVEVPGDPRKIIKFSAEQCTTKGLHREVLRSEIQTTDGPEAGVIGVVTSEVINTTSTEIAEAKVRHGEDLRFELTAMGGLAAFLDAVRKQIARANQWPEEYPDEKTINEGLFKSKSLETTV